MHTCTTWRSEVKTKTSHDDSGCPGYPHEPQRDAHDRRHDLSEPVDAHRKILVRFLAKTTPQQ